MHKNWSNIKAGGGQEASCRDRKTEARKSGIKVRSKHLLGITSKAQSRNGQIDRQAEANASRERQFQNPASGEPREQERGARAKRIGNYRSQVTY